MRWYGCPKRNGRKETVYPVEGKVQQGGAWTEAPKGTAREEGDCNNCLGEMLRQRYSMFERTKRT